MSYIGNDVQQTELVGAVGGDFAGIDLMTEVIEGNLALSIKQENPPKRDVNNSVVFSDCPSMSTFVASNAGESLLIDTRGYLSINFTTQDFIGNVLASNDGSRFTPVYGMVTTGAGTSSLNAANTNYVFPCIGRYIQIVSTTAGAVTYTLRNIPYQGFNLEAIAGAAINPAVAQNAGNLVQFGGTTSAGTAGFAAIGSSVAANGQTTGTVVTETTPTATTIKASAGKLYSLSVSNPGAAIVYLKVFNSAAVTLGVTPATLNYEVPPLSTIDLSIEMVGLYFAAGIVIAVTGGQALTDTTVITDSCAVNYSFI